MSAFASIFIYSVIMAICSFVTGIPPLLANLPPEKMNYISVFSTGLLVSAALVLIIPEGIEHSSDDSPIGICLVAGFVTLFTIDRLSSITRSSDSYLNSIDDSSTFNIDQDNPSKQTTTTEFDLDDRNIGSSQSEEPIDEDTGNQSLRSLWYTLRGNSLKSFICNLNAGFKSAFRNTDTLGLLIHSLTDGIALTSSIMASTEIPSVKSIFVILAIFLHKLPTAFALVALLVRDGLPKVDVLCHLIAFSLAAPLGALATYIIIVLFINGSIQGLSGMLLTFSGGSFLYVGFHALQKMDSGVHHDRKTRRQQLVEYLTCLSGMLVPVLVSLVRDED